MFWKYKYLLGNIEVLNDEESLIEKNSNIMKKSEQFD